MSVLQDPVLTLNRNWAPVTFLPVQTAITTCYRDMASVLDTKNYLLLSFDEWIASSPDTDRWIKTANDRIPAPDVILLKRYGERPPRRVVFNRPNLYRRDDYTCQYCISPSTLVLMSNLTWKAGGQVVVGDSVVGVDEERPFGNKSRRIKTTSVLKAVYFDGPRVLVKTDKGEIVVSSDHKFLAVKARGLFWVSAAGLSIGMSIKRVVRPWEDRSNTWLAGIVDGEGSLYARGGSLTIGQNEGAVLSRIRRELNDVSVSCVEGNVNVKTCKCKYIAITKLGDVLATLGSLRPARMIERVSELLDGHLGIGSCRQDAMVQSVEHLDPGKLVGLATGTHTLITDGYVSHNCGAEMPKLTVEHILPRSRGGKTDWLNCVAACPECNSKKADFTPEEAGMKLKKKPRRPDWKIKLALPKGKLLRPSWEPFLAKEA